jgi:outer membrane protein
VGEWVTHFEDPLGVRPTILDATASTLPGDEQAACTEIETDQLAAEIREPLSLGRSIDIALCNNAQIRASWANIKIQAASLGEAKAAKLPTSNLSVSQTSDQTTFPGSKFESTSMDTTTSSAGFNWRLFDFGGIESNRRSAASLLDAAIASHDATLQKTLSGVISAYFDAQTAHATWTSRLSQERLARRTQESASRKEARNVGSQTDTLQATTALARATLERSRASGVYKKALAVLVSAIGLPAGVQPELVEEDVIPKPTLHTDLQDWLHVVQQHHPSIRAAQLQVDASSEKLNAARSEGKPTLDLGVNYYENGRPNQALSPNKTQETLAVLTLNIPLFNGFSNTYKVKGAQAQLEQSQFQVIDVQNQILAEVVKAYAEIEAALDNLGASQQLFLAARLATESLQRRFDKGAADIMEVLNTQSAQVDAQLEQIRALADWRSARLRLLTAAGVMNRMETQTQVASKSAAAEAPSSFTVVPTTQLPDTANTSSETDAPTFVTVTSAPVPIKASDFESVEAVELAVANWAGAWSARNIEAYLAAYCKDCNPASAINRKKWEEERQHRIVGKPSISVKVDKLTVTVNGDSATAHFLQEYKAGRLAVSSRKKLEFLRGDDGWKILKEVVSGADSMSPNGVRRTD